MNHTTRLNGNEIQQRDLVPYAIITVSLSHFQNKNGLLFDRDEDDLDGYSIVYLDVDGTTVAMKHYDGEPADSITICLQAGMNEDDAEKTMGKVLKKYSLPRDSISWREKAPSPKA